MKILLSPAKSMDMTNKTNVPLVSIPKFEKEAEQLVSKLARLKPMDLSKLMSISTDLAQLNYERFQSWSSAIQAPCALSFTGEVYRGLQFSEFSEEEMVVAQEKIRILSGVYGILRPLDTICAYRLEMGTKWGPGKAYPTLYSYWKKKLTSSFLDELEENEVVVNLASNEYSKVLDWKKINATVLTPQFREFKNGQYKTVMMYAKHARGAMARYLVQTELKDIETLKGYNIDGYSYDDRQSSENEWVFVR
ncbi:MAG: hypothetical protein RIT43_2134 [Bacteroidota bacterium]|jgi:cytoplasmic iron level regulating protein YaaA (DUF328/UPF0246 family)